LRQQRRIAHTTFAAGDATTAFVRRHGDELRPGRNDGVTPEALAALLIYATGRGHHPWRGGRALRPSFPLPVRIEMGGATHEIEVIRQRDGSYAVWESGRAWSIAINRLMDTEIGFETSGLGGAATFLRHGDRLFILHRGKTISARDLTLAAPERADASGDGKVRAALNGRVVAVLVKPGEGVERGQPVMTLEAMKMEHVHTAGIAGVVAAVHAAKGDQIAAGSIIAEIEGAAEGA
jgi:geranyl-CoA carboxylase alpha subunit